MLTRRADKLRHSDVTPRPEYINRRALMAGAAGLVAAAMVPEAGRAATLNGASSQYSVDAKPTPKKFVTSYNNFYEFGTGKEDPAKNAHTLTTQPWSVAVDGLVGRPGTYALEDLYAPGDLEERIYRLRCVEGWSMVIPWIGFPLSKIIEMAGPASGAKYVAFETLVRPEELPEQRGLFQPLDWPYVEGLRLDEAMHPLSLMAVGLYGEVLPNQNGAPLRLVVPWKYGFKSIKSVVRITLTDKQPPTTWNLTHARE
jgi:sulfoxide reductase catalytic subunit YedY